MKQLLLTDERCTVSATEHTDGTLEQTPIEIRVQESGGGAGFRLSRHAFLELRRLCNAFVNIE